MKKLLYNIRIAILNYKYKSEFINKNKFFTEHGVDMNTIDEYVEKVKNQNDWFWAKLIVAVLIIMIVAQIIF